MQTNNIRTRLSARTLLIASALFATVHHASAQGTAFTYQGQLYNGASPANGNYDFQFTLYSTVSGGSPVVSPVTDSDVAVSNGVFMATINFGGVFDGANYWLDIAVRTNGATTFTELTPRQAITPTPYAIYAEGTTAAGLSGTVNNSQLANNSITVTAGTGLGGGGSVALGGSITLNNIGILSVTGNSDIVASTTAGAVTLGDTATNINTPNSIVKRDINGNFAASSLTLSSNLYLPEYPIFYDGLALFSHADNLFNFSIGPGAENLTMTGVANTAVGDLALDRIAGGDFNTAVGAFALDSNEGGSNNVAVGSYALDNITNGNYNTAVGAYSLLDNISGRYNTAVGYQSLMLNTANNNTAVGVQTLENNTTGTFNTAIGYTALAANSTGNFNTACGDAALSDNTTGALNTAVGFGALALNTTGSSNVAVGQQAMYVSTTGSNNVAVGYQSLESMIAGSCNAASGHESLWAANTGNNNTAFGCYALRELGSSNLKGGSNNIALGYQAGYSFINNESGNIVIGNVGVAGENNIIRIGTDGVQTATYLAGSVYANGTFVSSSDRNAKENITPLNPREILDKVAAMPVTRWNYKKNDPNTHIGPMAQDFYSAFNVGPDEKHITTIDEGGVALAAIQGLNQKLEAQDKAKDAEIQDLKQTVTDLKKMVESLAEKK